MIFLMLQLVFEMDAARIKDLIQVKGMRENPIVGHGIVVGLKGTGDSSGNITSGPMKNMLKKLGPNNVAEINSKNVAAVVVTANLTSFNKVGQKIDVTVSSIGDASSLSGGILLITHLRSGDDQVYAIASGNVSTGGTTNRIPTSGTISHGGIVEKEVESNFYFKNALRLNLNNPDFTNAARVAQVINDNLGGRYATAKDGTTIDLVIPSYYQRRPVELMSLIESYEINVDLPARIVINERTGTIVAGGNIMLRPVALAHSDLVINIEGGGDEDSRQSLYYNEGTSLNDLVNALNKLGATPQDLITIFQTLKKNGSLVGEIEVI